MSRALFGSNAGAVLIIISAIIVVTVFNSILLEMRTREAQEQRDAQTTEILQTQRELDEFAEQNSNDIRSILETVTQFSELNTNETRLILDRLTEFSVANTNDTRIILDRLTGEVDRQNAIVSKLDQIINQTAN